jgi:DNA repair photolyase
MANMDKSSQLFETFQDPAIPALRGLARLRAESEAHGEGHEVEYRELKTRSILNRSTSRRELGFRWSINPYRGCEFACRYCYARYTHEFMELRRAEDFERQIFIKQNAAVQLDKELRKLPAGELIAIGTATDPYQPIERREQLTQSLLRVLAGHQGFRVGLVTKSVLILRDIELLQTLSRRHQLTLHLTITTDDTDLARKLEPRAPRPDLRFRAVRRLREAGLRAGVLCSPAMPGINDSQPQLERMAYLAAAAKANFFASGALFLKPCSKGVFEDFLRSEFPALLPDYQRRYADSAFCSHSYQETLAARVEVACKKYGLGKRDKTELFPAPAEQQEGVSTELISVPKQQSFGFASLVPVESLSGAMVSKRKPARADKDQRVMTTSRTLSLASMNLSALKA